ncbi:SURF1 family protein [Caenibius tardaugens NBRC 16725]|nr:SURF1 family protein [Caenibius tardaugens NBRC 16725]
MRRLPVLPTLLVLVAVGVMIALGVWQLQRATWKEALLGRYDAAIKISAEVPFPYAASAREAALYHHSSVTCLRVLARNAIAGRNDKGEAGIAQTALCETPDGQAEIGLGWSRDPAMPEWGGGPVSGIIAPAGEGVRLIVSPPQIGLAQLAQPDPHDIPNNHRGYAMQWFFFAAAALVIYGLALRRKLAGASGQVA